MKNKKLNKNKIPFNNKEQNKIIQIAFNQQQQSEVKNLRTKI